MAFTSYSGNIGLAALVGNLLASNSGINVNAGTIALNASGPDTVSLYDGSLASLGIGAGLLLTSGYTPGLVNDIGWDGQDNSGTTGFANGDADIDAVVNTVFQTQSYDATSLEFDFQATDPNATSISFDVVFGSEEFPEWVDLFVDCAVVMVNGVNYALFNHDPNHPLSVVSSNLAAGYFQDNAGGQLQIQYDGVSQVLKIVAPINGNGATNHIKIGIADTGDHILDSGLFISNLSAGNIPGSGVVSASGGCTAGNDVVTGSVKDEYFDLQAGNDTVYAGLGDDIVVAGAGDDVVYGGSGADEMKGDAGNDWMDGGADADTAVFAGDAASYTLSYDGVSTTLTSVAEGVDTLLNVEFVKFKDGLYALNNGSLSLVDTTLPPATNAPGVVAISGIAMAGKSLTAIVGDADGINGGTTAISYQWLTSIDGVNWSDTGVTANSLALSEADIGKQIMVTASYIDASGNPEAPVSKSVAVVQATSGITINPMVIAAPSGASVMDPLTTLVKNAVDFGYTPNEAALAVKSVLGVAADINIAAYDAYAALTQNPGDAAALAFIKIAAQVAMTASVSDPTGVNLTLAVLNAAAAGTPLDLTLAADLASAGIDTGSLSVVQGLNKDMAAAGNFSTVQLVWNDWAGQKDNLKPFLDHLDVISIHINLAPSGAATATLETLQDAALAIAPAELLAGFNDPEGAPLQVAGLTLDQGGSLVFNGDGSWTFTPDPGFSGPIELTYSVVDPQGAAIAASTMLIVTPAPLPPPHVDQAATGTLVVTGTSAEGGALAAVLTASDIDGAISVTYSWQELANGAWVNLDGQVGATLSIPDDQSYVGKTVRVLATTLDTLGGTSEFVSAESTIANVNDAPTGSVSVSGNVQQGQVLTAGNSLADSDGIPFSGAGAIQYQWLEDGTAIAGANGSSYALTQADVGKVISVSASYTDLFGAHESVLSAPAGIVGGVFTGNKSANVLTGTGGDDSLFGLAGNDKLNGGAGNDRLIGGAGNDVLTGGSGADVFRFDGVPNAKSNLDSITDFLSGTDRIELENAVFTKLAAGSLAAASFVANAAPKAVDANDFILYNTTTGTLYYDADGSGKGVAIPIVTLVGHPDLSFTDFLVT